MNLEGLEKRRKEKDGGSIGFEKGWSKMTRRTFLKIMGGL